MLSTRAERVRPHLAIAGHCPLATAPPVPVNRQRNTPLRSEVLRIPTPKSEPGSLHLVDDGTGTDSYLLTTRPQVPWSKTCTQRLAHKSETPSVNQTQRRPRRISFWYGRELDSAHRCGVHRQAGSPVGVACSLSRWPDRNRRWRHQSRIPDAWCGYGGQDAMAS